MGTISLKLPFRQETPDLPDSLPMAERLTWLKGKMQREPIFGSKYTSEVEKDIAEGASRQVPDDELVNLKLIWYLPDHAVWHPKKPEDLRVVLDCTSWSGGKLLNQQLLRGPENTSSLIGVILRFRVEKIAVAIDIKRMWHQSIVEPGVFCGGQNRDIAKDPKTHQDKKEDFLREVVDAIHREFYVDDLLMPVSSGKSCSQEEALKLLNGFQILVVFCQRSLLRKEHLRSRIWI